MDIEKLANKIQEAKSKYHKLILLLSPFADMNTKCLKEASQKLGHPYINFSLSLAGKLVDIPVGKRSSMIVNLLSDFARDCNGDVLFLDHVELLFLRDLEVDPLRALQSISRNKVVVAAWAGDYDGKKLVYAGPGQPEYKKYQDLKEEDCTIFRI